MNLAGLPFTLGFYIKHVLLAFMFKDTIFYYLVIGFIVIAALAGLVYSFRLYYYVFFDIKKGRKFVYSHSNRNDIKSIFYANTTIASNIAIFSLICAGYTLCTYLYFLIFTKVSISEAFDVISTNSPLFFNLN
jgi:NADH:ubiquinone oxidoreductase subunit 5 (subunit L)/multisubunit Na+/H+ antiporter MnhA subunit